MRKLYFVTIFCSCYQTSVDPFQVLFFFFDDFKFRLYPCQGETVTLRLPCGSLKPVNLAVGSLYFSDGSQKTLAAFIVWISLVLAAQLEHNQGKFGADANVQALAGSLLRMRTVLKGSAMFANDLDSAVARIVRQNLDSKVQPVSSLAWTSILKSLGGESVGSTFENAMMKYNNHPEVVALDANDGAGPISLDNRKKQAGIVNTNWCGFPKTIFKMIE